MRIVITREYKKEQTACRNALKKWLRKNKKPVTYMADVLHYDRSSFNKWLNKKSNMSRERLDGLKEFIGFEYIGN